MKKLRMMVLFIIGIMIAMSGRAMAGDVTFKFTIPTIPFTPILSAISNSSAVAGEQLTVYASIVGDTQKKACCGTPCNSKSDCELNEWYMMVDPEISPNPPCIPNPKGNTGVPATSNPACVKTGNPKLYYYTNTDVAYPQLAEMEYDSVTKKFKGVIPLTEMYKGDFVYYYIIASDSRGNVISMLPDKNSAACKSASSWDSKYETPPIANCSVATGYEECSKNKSGTPTCGTSFSVNDRTDDTCGQPDANGVQNIQTGQGPVDLLGFSASAGTGFGDLPGTEVMCTKIGLNGTPPMSGGSIDGLLMIFFNPDINDPNPADIYMPNVLAISFAPEAAGADPNLVKVLWDGECITNPNTSTGDMLGKCKAVVGNDSETKLKIGFNNGTLKFIAKNEVQTYSGKRTIIGQTSGTSRMIFLTGQINLTGGTPFWLNDLSTGLMMVKDTKSVTVGEAGIPQPPVVIQTTCKANGSGSSSICEKSLTQPANNQCIIDFAPSPDSFATGYKIYHSTNPDAEKTQSLAEFLDDVNKTATSYTYTTSALDGKTHYFFMTSVGSAGETSWKDAASATKTTCRVEDWQKPLPPTIDSCTTPVGSEKKCSCTWTPPANDPSMNGYDVKVKDTVTSTTRTIANNTLNTFINDEGAEGEPLVNNRTYEYSVRSVDIGNNKSDEWATKNCIPEDKKAPSQVDSLSVSRKAGVLGITASWEPSTESDIGGYKLYGCKRTSEGIDCETQDGSNGGSGYTQIQSTFPQSSSTITATETDIFGGSAAWWCFWVQACDNCKTVGSCPTNESANCSIFSTVGNYRKCLKVSLDEHLTAPLWPPNQTDGKELKATPEAEGNKCKLEWNKICNGEGAEGDFNSKCEKCPAGGCDPNPCTCDYPDNLQLSGYKVMRSNTSIVPTPGDATAVLSLGTSSSPSGTDSGLTNDSTYYYRVYGIDGAGLFSRSEPVPAAVTCTPHDSLAPNKPTFDAETPMAFSKDYCTPKWNAVTDKDQVKYDVYRCEITGGVTCTNSTEFTKVTDTSISEPPLEYMDSNVEENHNYVYCLTASDLTGNKSKIYEADDHDNCLPCTPGDKCPAPGSVTAFEYDDNYGAAWQFTKSSKDNGDGTYATGEGYNVYYCSGATVGTCTTKLNSSLIGKICTDEEDEVCKKGRYISTAAGENSHIAVTYTGGALATDCKESVKTISSNAINVKPQPPSDPCCVATPPADCTVKIDFSFNTTNGVFFKKYDMAACTYGSDTTCLNNAFKRTDAPLSGVTVELWNDTTSTQVKKLQTEADGTFGTCTFYAQSGSINTTDNYKVRARVPASAIAGNTVFANQCVNKTRNPETDECIVELSKTVKFTTTGKQTLKVAPPVVPPAADGFGGDVGNANCDTGDGKVNINDLAAIKYAYNTKRGDACYRAWADFNSDGKVNINDLSYLKNNNFYNKTFYTSNPNTPKLCPSASATANEMKPLKGTCCDKTSPLYPCTQ